PDTHRLPRPFPTRRSSDLTKALVAMHESPSKNWTIHKLAEVAGMSRSSFAQRFKEVVGIPPLTYLMDYRLRLAARYLRLQQNSIDRKSTRLNSSHVKSSYA